MVKRKANLVVAAIVALMAIGASADRADDSPPPNGMISGQVVSGDIPIAGATVTLFEDVGTGCPGFGRGPGVFFFTSVTFAQVRTDMRGGFAIDLSKATAEIPGCSGTKLLKKPGAGSYLIANGGNAAAGENSAIKLKVALGRAPTAERITINELTTVASVFSPELVRSFIDLATGRPLPTLADGFNSPALLNTLADIIATCVRSSGPASALCKRLFALVPRLAPEDAVWRFPVREIGQPPKDTLAAVEAIVRVPTENTAALFALLPSGPPYKPTLSTPPTAWLFSVNFLRGGFRRPTEIIYDEPHDVLWIANTGGDSVIELSTRPASFGAPLSGVNGYHCPGLRAPGTIWAQRIAEGDDPATL